MPLDQAVVDAGAVRFRPMLLTAAAVVVGAGVILFDPIFQGLAISLMAGEVASLLAVAHGRARPVLHGGAPRAGRGRGAVRQMEDVMTVERSLRLIAGGFVAASTLLGMFVSPYFLWFTVFVGLNLFQSAFTGWCPMMAVLRKAGVPD